MPNSFVKRLEKIERINGSRWSDVLVNIRCGKTYADLTEEQKERYCEYRGVSKKAMETVCKMVSGCDIVDFPLSYVLTEKESNEMISKNAEDIELIVLKYGGENDSV